MDLHTFPVTPKQSRRRKVPLSSRKKVSLKEYSQGSDVLIEWKSESEDDYKTPQRKRDESDRKFCMLNEIRSTPSGSPILSKKLPTAQKLHSTGSLVPISPISPNDEEGHSFSKSCISLHVTGTNLTKNLNIGTVSAFDSTILAVPLDNSRESDDDDYMSPELTITSNHPSQDVGAKEEECISTQSSEQTAAISQITSEKCDDDHIVDNSKISVLSKGSMWLETVCDKINEERSFDEKNANLSINMSTNVCDLMKNTKCKKVGLAEQLLKVLKKQTSEQVIFTHQIKVKQQYPGKILYLQVISNHTEGLLNVINCKNMSISKTEENYYSIILPKEVSQKHNLQLLTKFKIYSPWYEQKLVDIVYPVLLSVSKIAVLNDDDNNIELEERRETIFNESLLSAIENQRVPGVISIVATVQRIFSKLNIEKKQTWTLLLEDSFGVFVELALSEESVQRKAVLDILMFGEGQRITIDNVMVDGRVTKSQCPQLFEIIVCMGRYW